jgi:hypothetical protein
VESEYAKTLKNDLSIVLEMASAARMTFLVDRDLLEMDDLLSKA